MRRLITLTTATTVWLLTGLMGHASADSNSLTIEQFRYGYEASGKPGVYLTIDNQGVSPANTTIRATLKEAYSSSQNDYLYRKRGATKPITVSVAPGATRDVELPVNRLLPYGSYEAIVDVDNNGGRSQEWFEFDVSEEEVLEANKNMQANHVEGVRGTPSEPGGNWLPFAIVAMLIVGLTAAVVAMKARRNAKNNR